MTPNATHMGGTVLLTCPHDGTLIELRSSALPFGERVQIQSAGDRVKHQVDGQEIECATCGRAYRIVAFTSCDLVPV